MCDLCPARRDACLTGAFDWKTAMALDRGIDEKLHALAPLLEGHAQVEVAMSTSETLTDPMLAYKVGWRLAELFRVKTGTERYLRAEDSLIVAREFVQEGPSFVSEIPELEDELCAAHEGLLKIPAPHKPEDALDVIPKIEAGEGGEEPTFFASDLTHMYSRYAESKGWFVTELPSTPTELGGFKEISLAIRARGTPLPEEGVWAHLKYKGRVYRVQRVPVAESQR